MLKNYLTIALRHLRRYQAHSVISISSLTVGIACCLLLVLYIKDEMSYDRHHKHASELFRVTSSFVLPDGNQVKVAASSPPIVMTMLQEFPEIMNATRVVKPMGVDQNLIQYGEKSFFETNGLIADSTFFQMFDYTFIEGNANAALRQANAVVVTEALAQKIFSRNDVVGEVISISNNFGKYDYKVTGVLKETGKKTHIDAHFFTSMASEGLGQIVMEEENWAGQNYLFSYIQLVPEASAEALESKMEPFLNKYGAKDLKALGMDKSLHLQAVTDIHLQSDFDNNNDLSQHGSITYIYVMSAIAIFMLVIACINFMNLSTAKAAQRAGEVGVRKTLGASQATLIRQFLGEAMVLVVIAVLASLLMVEVLLPFFNQLTGKYMALGDLGMQYYVSLIVVITLITGLLAGGYPAFFLSSFQPASVFKGKVSGRLSTGLLRKFLVVFQFVIAICLISGVVIMYSQLNFIQQRNLGFNTESRLLIPLHTMQATENYPLLKDKLRQESEIQHIAASNAVPGQDMIEDMAFYPPGSSMESAILCQRYFVDEGLIESLQVKVVEGRSFDLNRDERGGDKVLLNEMALKELGIPLEKALGHTLYTEWEGERYNYEIIGIINDFHQFSMHRAIVPMIFHLAEGSEYNYALASIHPGDMQQALQHMEQDWKEVNPDLPFEYVFLDQQLQKQYESDQRATSVISSFMMVAILISCLGLYSLSAFVAERKVKEVGIRKVFGARVSTIITLLSREFTILVGIAFLISLPLSYYAMQQWLQGFAYHISLGPGFFMIAGIIALIIAWVTISYHAIKAAMANPVNSLRSE